ncbi:MAG TPA: 1,4-dihydroxy-2-naphthoate polyprenyltransferase [Acidimicrobiia bacterium]|nr:1,4-dihydroxy-2-naphthoate polyprenyltransferase [Acidimicrobiia bacterium]
MPSSTSATRTLANTPGTSDALTRFEAWKTAARVHTLPAAVVPVLVGAGLALGQEVFRLDAFTLALVGAVAIQVAANFANDVSDAKRGVDSTDRLGPPRMVALGVLTPREMWTGVVVAILIAAVAGIGLAYIAGPLILIVGVVSIIAMLGYVGGPSPYGYRGLGEIFVFVFFGLVATVCSRYVHDMTAPAAAWLLAIPVGMLVTAILVANNYRDLDTDRETGKRTLAVILGREKTRWLYATLIYGAFVLIVVFAVAGWTPLPTLFAAMLAPYAVGPVRTLWQHSDGPSLIRALVMNSRLHLWTGIVLAAGAAL